MVSLGELNSRMKDFYDLFTLARAFAFDGPSLATAIAATFERRETDLPQQEPIALRPGFAELRGKPAQWQAFVRRSRLLDESVTLAMVVAQLHGLLWPFVGGLIGARTAPRSWPQGGPWS